ncbi:Lysophospholipase L1 or related esterase [Mycobacterium rhizamassiliense]|jgi:lysophospholipase L1-like esterase|uniref:Lysophospholipase L1 or related esterase n=2 Tax=Mycobacterium rhizamassiliense TaxID=1841860 RepID=A0A2U3NV10_9MYCO|nr:Lysophospholipase L1 or related esterase [Mycobacterium rhizamassiliense]
MRLPRRSTIALATAGALASTGTAYLGARNLLVGQATHARTVIPKAWDVPPRADGVYTPGGGPVERWQRGMSADLHLMIFGDSTATGYGCMSAEEVPGVLVARGLAAQTGKRIRLSTKAIVGATSKGVSGQVDAMFVAGAPPDLAVMMIGANDITALNGITPSARRLGRTVTKLRNRGAVVVVGTCPDLGVISAIPQPLRSLAHARTARLARAQAAAVRSAGGTPVPLANLLAPQFRATPELMFSADGFHPSPTAYALAAAQLLVALCDALGQEVHSPVLNVAARSGEPEFGPANTRLSAMARLWRRPASSSAAPSSYQETGSD